jgi:hypothetical protein
MAALRFGTNVGVFNDPDGSIRVYVDNAEPVILRFPKWFSQEDKTALINVVKESYLVSARRVLLEQTGVE